MHANAVQRIFPSRNGNFAVKQSSAFKAMSGNVFIFPTQDGKATENGVSVMAMIIDGVSAVSVIWPDGICQKLILGNFWPILEAEGKPRMRTNDFLQKNNVHAEATQAIAQFVQYQD